MDCRRIEIQQLTSKVFDRLLVFRERFDGITSHRAANEECMRQGLE